MAPERTGDFIIISEELTDSNLEELETVFVRSAFLPVRVVAAQARLLTVQVGAWFGGELPASLLKSFVRRHLLNAPLVFHLRPTDRSLTHTSSSAFDSETTCYNNSESESECCRILSDLAKITY